MANYRLPMDADGVKYHGVTDEDGKFPGQVLYGLDKNGRLKPVNVDDEGNVLTRVTGSIDVLEVIKDTSFESGEMVTVLNNDIPRLRYKEVRCTIRTDDRTDIEIYLEHTAGHTNMITSRTQFLSDENVLVLSGVVGQIYGDHYRVRVRNTGDVDTTLLECKVIGVV